MIRSSETRKYALSFSTVAATFLFICFVLPSFQGCGDPVYPYRELDFSGDTLEDAFRRIWEYILPYAGGLIMAFAHIRMLKKGGDDFAGIRFLVMGLALCAVLEPVLMYAETLPGMVLGLKTDMDFTMRMEILGSLFLYGGILVILLFTVLSSLSGIRKIALYQAAFALIYTAYFSMCFYYYNVFYGAKIALGALIMLALSADMLYRTS